MRHIATHFSTAIILILLGTFRLFSETAISGVIEHDERWTAENGPYVINDDLLITRDTRIAVSPGTEIIIGKPMSYDPRIPQIDNLDSFTVSIRVEGVLSCVGRADNRITFTSRRSDSSQCSWYGILLDNAITSASEIAFTDICGACNGLTVKKCSALIRNCVFENNNVGLICTENSAPKIYNCVIAHNLTTGIRVYKSNPVFYNNIIAFNRNNGLWSDGISHIVIEYNCIFGNEDGDLLGCDPELGVIKRANKNKDSTDYKYNLFVSPVFKGSVAESLSVEHDISRQTDKSRLKDTTLAKVFYDSLADSAAYAYRRQTMAFRRYTLSRYSPCINAGNPKNIFTDDDNTPNDIGIWGGPEFFDAGK